MTRRVKEFVDIADHLSLDELIEKLAEVRDGLPEVAMVGRSNPADNGRTAARADPDFLTGQPLHVCEYRPQLPLCGSRMRNSCHLCLISASRRGKQTFTGTGRFNMFYCG
jgi:hypothetical protein